MHMCFCFFFYYNSGIHTLCSCGVLPSWRIFWKYCANILHLLPTFILLINHQISKPLPWKYKFLFQKQNQFDNVHLIISRMKIHAKTRHSHRHSPRRA